MDIKTFRDGLGLSLREMGLELGISGQAVHAFESGKSKPSPETAWRYIDLAEDHRIKLKLEDIFPRNGN